MTKLRQTLKKKIAYFLIYVKRSVNGDNLVVRLPSEHYLHVFTLFILTATP